MPGLFAMMICYLGVTAFLAYWISWEIQNKETRPSFWTTIRTDLVELLGKRRDAARNTRFGTVTATRQGTGHAQEPV